MTRLIVDGYNLLSADPAYAVLKRRDFQLARERLISDLASVAGSVYDQVTVVFDGAGNTSTERPVTVTAGVTVIYSPAGQEADTVVEALAHEARRAGEPAVVVTSDRDTRWAAAGGSVSVIRSERFIDEMRETVSEWTDHVPAGRRNVRLEDRIDPQTRHRMWQWLRRKD